MIFGTTTCDRIPVLIDIKEGFQLLNMKDGRIIMQIPEKGLACAVNPAAAILNEIQINADSLYGVTVNKHGDIAFWR